MHNCYFLRRHAIMRNNLALCKVAHSYYLVCLMQALPFQAVHMRVHGMAACSVVLSSVNMQNQWLILLSFCSYSRSKRHPVMAVYNVKILFFCYLLCCKSIPIHFVKQCRAVNFLAWPFF